MRTAAFFLELGRKSRGVPLPLVPLTRTGKRTPCKHVSQSSLEQLLVWFLWIASGVHVVPGVAIHEGPACRIALISHWIASPTHVHGRARYRTLLLTVLGRIWRSSQDSRGHLLFLARRSIVRCSRGPWKTLGPLRDPSPLLQPPARLPAVVPFLEAKLHLNEF